MRFLRFQPKLGHAVSMSMPQNLPKTAQICQNLPKAETLKIEILVFFKIKIKIRVEEALEHVSTVWIFNPRIFHMLFLLSKNGLCMCICIPPCGKLFFPQCFTPLVGMRF
jgi:hypothetical protein